MSYVLHFVVDHVYWFMDFKESVGRWIGGCTYMSGPHKPILKFSHR